MLNTAQLNTKQLNDGPDLSVVLGGIAPRAVEKYVLEARSKNGNLYATLPGFWDGEYVARLNQAHELRFKYDATLDAAAYLTTANQVWLRDDAGNLIQRFHNRNIKPTREDNVAYADVTGLSILSQLFDEWILEYDATATIKNHLKAWIAAQKRNLPIRLGAIHSAYGSQSFAFKYDASRIRNAFADAYDAVGEGDFWVDPSSRRLNWKTKSGDNKGQRIVYGMNAQGIVKTEDDSELFTRLYLYGEGNGVADALNLIDAGEANKYIDHNTGTYGIITNVIVMKEIKDAATLLAVAEAIIARHSSPRICYEIDVADYSNSNDGPDFSFERLRLGSTVKVIDDTLGIEINAKVVEIRFNLDNPLDIRVTLDNKPKDLRHIIRELLERVETLETEPPEYSDATPTPVGTGGAGTSRQISRGDHSHAIDPDALADLIENDETVGDAIETVASGAGPSPGSPVLTVGQSNVDGSSADYARVDHVHKGNSFTAADFASLPSEAVGSIGVTTGSLKYGHIKTESALWQRFTHI